MSNGFFYKSKGEVKGKISNQTRQVFLLPALRLKFVDDSLKHVLKMMALLVIIYILVNLLLLLFGWVGSDLKVEIFGEDCATKMRTKIETKKSIFN